MDTYYNPVDLDEIVSQIEDLNIKERYSLRVLLEKYKNKKGQGTGS